MGGYHDNMVSVITGVIISLVGVMNDDTLVTILTWHLGNYLTGELPKVDCPSEVTTAVTAALTVILDTSIWWLDAFT